MAAQAAVLHEAGIMVPRRQIQSQDAAQLVGHVDVGQEATGVEAQAWRHLLAILQPGHLDGPW